MWTGKELCSISTLKSYACVWICPWNKHGALYWPQIDVHIDVHTTTRDASSTVPRHFCAEAKSALHWIQNFFLMCIHVHPCNIIARVQHIFLLVVLKEISLVPTLSILQLNYSSCWTGNQWSTQPKALRTAFLTSRLTKGGVASFFTSFSISSSYGSQASSLKGWHIWECPRTSIKCKPAFNAFFFRSKREISLCISMAH